MDLKLSLTVFVTIFLAELGDKTQLATMLYASKEPSKLIAVFAGALMALMAATVMAVVVGGQLANWLNPKWVNLGAGILFIGVGVWTIFSTQGTTV